ncbi:MAG: hypothetical protein M5U12_34660 [Verrucomicrobia bacterium]|nr:hypothetical protein [Verrucomicrobiota bacterium]
MALLLSTLFVRADVMPAEEAPAPAPAPKLAQATPSLDAVGDLITFTTKYDQAAPFLPGPYDPNVTRLTAQMLMTMHYSRHALDEEYAQRFYDRYLDILDPQRLHFTQADLDEFEPYARKLSELTFRDGDTKPANEIFARFLKRLDQRAAFVARLLQANQFDFTSDERYTPNRKGAARPADLAAAESLWRQHLRHEYLLEKLNRLKPAEITEKLAKRYKRQLRVVAEFDRDDVLQFYLSALANAYDPHSGLHGQGPARELRHQHEARPLRHRCPAPLRRRLLHHRKPGPQRARRTQQTHQAQGPDHRRQTGRRRSHRRR